MREAGCFVLSWSQTELDGVVAAPIDAARRGATWRWHGQAVRIDALSGMGQVSAKTLEGLRGHAEERARQVLGRALVAEGFGVRQTADRFARAQTLTVNDGPKRYTFSILDAPELARPLLLVLGDLPPSDAALRVTVPPERPDDVRYFDDTTEGVVCFTEGTWLETPRGQRQVNQIAAGDKVVTKDNGTQEVLWVGVRHISQARLWMFPDLRPVRLYANAMSSGRPSETLWVSPDHRMLVRGAVPQHVFGEPEVLVAARDLVGRPGIGRPAPRSSVTYYHLMLERHGILVANGVETESFHPGAATLSALADDQRARLYDIMPTLAEDVGAYGPLARRALSPAEATRISRAA